MKRSSKLRGRFWIESALAVVATVLFAATAATPNWVEAVFGFDPDANSGLLEWATVALAITALACVLLARLEWRKRALAGA